MVAVVAAASPVLSVLAAGGVRRRAHAYVMIRARSQQRRSTTGWECPVGAGRPRLGLLLLLLLQMMRMMMMTMMS